MSTKRKFSTGDRVICVSPYEGQLPAGETGTVADPPYENDWLMVLRTGWIHPNGWGEYRWDFAPPLMADTRDYLTAIAGE